MARARLRRSVREITQPHVTLNLSHARHMDHALGRHRLCVVGATVVHHEGAPPHVLAWACFGLCFCFEFSASHTAPFLQVCCKHCDHPVAKSLFMMVSENPGLDIYSHLERQKDSHMSTHRTSHAHEILQQQETAM